MTNRRQAFTKKQKTNLENAYKWFHRAQKDFNAFRQLVPFDKNSLKTVRCSDPALAVYLLQQSIEKATKSVAAATGKYPYGRLKSHGHNSLVVLLDFYQEILNAMANKVEGLRIIGEGFGLNVKNGLGKIENLKAEAKKTPKDRRKDEILYREQYAVASAAEIDKILDMLLLLREQGFVGALKSIFGPHGKVLLDGQGLNTGTPGDFVSSVLEEAGKKLKIPQLSEDQLKSMSALVEVLAPNGFSDEDKTEKNIVIRRDTEQQLGQWSLISLLYLAAFTFPHESTSRYPGPHKKKTLEPAGCEDYDENLGIVNRLGRMGYVTMLAMDELKPELETIAAFLPIVESRL